MSTAGYLNKYINKKQDTKSVISQQSSKKVSVQTIQSTTTEGRTKEDILTKMQQNEEKHRQLMHENNKRRKEQEKKLKMQEEEKQKQAATLLEQRKKTKEQAYVNYLRNNTKNILEGYQPRQTDYPKQNPKPNVEKKVQTNYNTNFEALDLEVSQVTKNKKLPQEFQKQWEDFEVMRKSELLDSLDLSTANKVPHQQKKTDLHTILGLPEENSDDEEDLWKNTLKNGQLAKPPSKPPLSKPLQWADQALQDDVLSKMSQKQGNAREQRGSTQKPSSETLIQQKQSTSVPRKENISKNQEQIRILQQKEQQLLAQQQKIQTQLQNTPPSIEVNNPPIPPRKPQQNIRITNKPIPKQPSSVQDEQNHIQEFLKEDLQNINDLEIQLQLELMNINKENKQKIDQIEQKYGVRNLQSSNQVNRIVFVQNQAPIKSQEDQIEASLLKLDLMLQQPPQRPAAEQMIQQPIQQVQKPYQIETPPTPPPPQNQLNPIQYQQLLEQQAQLQQQLLTAQQQIQNMQQQQLQKQQQQIQQQQTQQQMTQQQQQTMNSQGEYFPRFPSYVLHQDHQSFVQTFTTGLGQPETAKQIAINARPRNVITHESQSVSIVSSQQNDKYTFDLDFGGQKNTYSSQAQKKVTQKQSQVKQSAPIEEEEEHEDGKIEVRQDLRNLLFD